MGLGGGEERLEWREGVGAGVGGRNDRDLAG